MFLPLCLGPFPSVSPNLKENGNANINDPSVVGLTPGSAGFFGGARAFKDMFNEAMQGGCVEVRRVLSGGRSTRACGGCSFFSYVRDLGFKRGE